MNAPDSRQRMITVGRLHGAFGVRGEVKLESFTDPLRAIAKYEPWTLRDARNPTKILASGSSTGSSQLFVSSNLQTARNNALPEALAHAGEALVSRISNGF